MRMSEEILRKKLFFHPHTFFLLCGFVLFHLFSYFFRGNETLQAIVVILFLFELFYLYIRDPRLAWGLIMAEIFLDGAGQSFQLLGISIRTILLGTYLLLFTGHSLLSKEFRNKITVSKQSILLFGTLFLVVAVAFFNGNLSGNPLKNTVQDALPFLFLLLTIPSAQYLQEKKYQVYFVRLLIVFLFGNVLFSLFTFILFSTGHFHIQDPYYKWFRDISAGKITDLKNGFFRIVLPEHLLVTPLALMLSSFLMEKEKNKKLLSFLVFCSLILLALNLSRAYFLGLFVGLCMLWYKHSFKRWLLTSLVIGLSTVATFCLIYFAASRGQSFGLEVFGLRIHSLVAPQIEESSYTRTALLAPIWDKITQRPIVGSGLGSSVTFTNPVTKTLVNTSQFDWGYLEMWSELGIIGLFVYIIFLVSLFIFIIQKKTIHTGLRVGLLAGLISLSVINITGPALFHIFGLFFISCALACTLPPATWWQEIKARVFSK